MKKLTPSKSQYLRAKKITDAYEFEQRCIHYKNYISFCEALRIYFEHHKVCGKKVKSYTIADYSDVGSDYFIVIYDPDIQLKYDGSNDKDIEKLCKKYNIKCRMLDMYYKDYIKRNK